jgi:hypothetical protein
MGSGNFPLKRSFQMASLAFMRMAEIVGLLRVVTRSPLGSLEIALAWIDCV